MFNSIRSLVDLLAVYLGNLGVKYPLFRKEQSVPKPVYPFAAYKILSVGGLDYSIKREMVEPDPAKLKFQWEKVQTAVVSLSFYNLENNSISRPIEVIYQTAQDALDWLSITGKEQIRELGIVVELINQQIQDRTVYLDRVYEYQLGFDFKVKALRTLVETVPAVDMDATIEQFRIDNG